MKRQINSFRKCQPEEHDARRKPYSLTMLVINIIQLLAQTANLFGIFILIGIIPGRDSSDWKSSNEIYRSILVLYSFINLIKIFGFVWIIGLVWKLWRINRFSENLNYSEKDNSKLSNSDGQGIYIESILVFFFLILRLG